MIALSFASDAALPPVLVLNGQGGYHNKLKNNDLALQEK